MTMKIREEFYTVTLPADGKPVRVLSFNTSVLQWFLITANGDIARVSKVGGSEYPLLKGQTYGGSGSDYHGAAIDCMHDIWMKAKNNEEVTVSVWYVGGVY